MFVNVPLPVKRTIRTSHTTAYALVHRCVGQSFERRGKRHYAESLDAVCGKRSGTNKKEMPLGISFSRSCLFAFLRTGRLCPSDSDAFTRRFARCHPAA